MKQVEKIIVAGAGVMGAGIAQVCAMHGYKVTLYDISQSGLDKGKASIEKNLNKAIQIGKATEEIKETAIANIQYEIEVANLKGDLVIEAVIEKLEIKASLFNTLLDQNPDIILADEPTGNLDSENSVMISNILFKYVKEEGSSLIMVTHDPKLANKAKRKIKIKDGKIA